MPKFRNKSVHDLDLHLQSGMHRVKAGDAVDVPEDEAVSLAEQAAADGYWDHADDWRPPQVEIRGEHGPELALDPSKAAAVVPAELTPESAPAPEVGQ